MTVSDKAGNPASAGASVLVDTTVPQITFDIVAGDDIVNIAEHGRALIVTGKVTGAQAGDVITLTLNGKDYTAMLDGAGNWSVGVPATDVGARWLTAIRRSPPRSPIKRATAPARRMRLTSP